MTYNGEMKRATAEAKPAVWKAMRAHQAGRDHAFSVIMVRMVPTSNANDPLCPWVHFPRHSTSQPAALPTPLPPTVGGLRKKYQPCEVNGGPSLAMAQSRRKGW